MSNESAGEPRGAAVLEQPCMFEGCQLCHLDLQLLCHIPELPLQLGVLLCELLHLGLPASHCQAAAHPLHFRHHRLHSEQKIKLTSRQFCSSTSVSTLNLEHILEPYLLYPPCPCMPPTL